MLIKKVWRSLKEAIRSTRKWSVNEVQGAVLADFAKKFIYFIFGGAALGFTYTGVQYISGGSNQNSQEFVRAEALDSSYSIQFAVDSMFISPQNAAGLDVGAYVVEPRLGFAIKQPQGRFARREQEVEPGFFTGLSPATIPFFGYLLDSVKELALTSPLRQGDVLTNRFLLGGPTIVRLGHDSRMGSVPLDYNPVSDPEISNASIKAVLKLLEESEDRQVSSSADLLEAALDRPLIKKRINKGVQKAIAERTPSSISIQNGITIKSFNKSYLATSPIVGETVDFRHLTGFGYFTLLQMLNPEMAAFALQDLDVSKNGQVLLYDSSIFLNNVATDFSDKQRLEVVKIFLVAASDDYVHVARLQYINGTSRRVERKLENAFRSIRIIGGARIE